MLTNKYSVRAMIALPVAIALGFALRSTVQPESIAGAAYVIGSFELGTIVSVALSGFACWRREPLCWIPLLMVFGAWAWVYRLS